MEQLGHLSDGAEVQGGVRPIVVAGDFDCILYGSENGDVAVHVFVQLVGKSHQFVEILAVLSFLVLVLVLAMDVKSVSNCTVLAIP